MFVFCVCCQKTSYEMRISVWSSDVCSSDLDRREARVRIQAPELVQGGLEAFAGARQDSDAAFRAGVQGRILRQHVGDPLAGDVALARQHLQPVRPDRKSVV